MQIKQISKWLILFTGLPLTALGADVNINSVLEGDVLCDPTSNSWFYKPTPGEATINALSEAGWLSNRPIDARGEKVYKVEAGKKWLDFSIHTVTMPNESESTVIFGSKVELGGRASNVSREIDKVISGGLAGQDFKPAASSAGQSTFKRVVRYRDGLVYSVVVNEARPGRTMVFCSIGKMMPTPAKK